MTVKILGLDLSLTSTGVAQYDPAGIVPYTTTRLKTPAKVLGHDRLEWLLARIHTVALGADYIIVEGPAFGAKGSAYHQLAGMWWLVTHALWTMPRRVAVAPPSSIKRFATGKGNAGKDEVLSAVVRRYPDFNGGNDEADALVAAALVAEKFGCPIVAVPKTHLTALDGVEWADLPGDQS